MDKFVFMYVTFTVNYYGRLCCVLKPQFILAINVSVKNCNAMLQFSVKTSEGFHGYMAFVTIPVNDNKRCYLIISY